MKWHGRPAWTIFLYFLLSSLVTKFIIQLTETVPWTLDIPPIRTAGLMLQGCWLCDRKLKDSVKSAFCSFSASIPARTCTPTLHMSCNAKSICPSYKGQGINYFSRIDNTEGRSRWEWPGEAIIYIFQNTGARHLNPKTPWLQGITHGSSSLF